MGFPVPFPVVPDLLFRVYGPSGQGPAAHPDAGTEQGPFQFLGLFKHLQLWVSRWTISRV